jgi:predicted DNA-binding transcriptional regulator AlpA
MSTITQVQQVKLIKASELAEVLGISMRHFWRLKAAKELPKPIQLRNSVRWRLSDIEIWLQIGCPNAAAFQRYKKRRRG